MALKRNKINRIASQDNEKSKILDFPANWNLTIESKNHGLIKFDFDLMREKNRDEITGHIRDAIWSMRYASEGISLSSYYNAAKRFFNFLDYLYSLGEKVEKLKSIDRKFIDRYLIWLDLQIIPSGQKNSGAVLSQSTKRNAYSGIKAILINRKKLNPLSVSESLDFPYNPFPPSKKNNISREAYSDNEQNLILSALNNDLKIIYEKKSPELPELQVLIVYLLCLASSTGLNLQPLLELKRNSLRLHPLQDRELLTTEKRRGWTSFATSSRKSETPPDAQQEICSIPSSVGDHFRALASFTLPLVKKSDNFFDNYVFLLTVSKGPRKGGIIRVTRYEAKTGIQSFSKRHKLLDDKGNLMILNFSRFRPTFATGLYRRTKDIRQVSKALGHASIETTARSYIEVSSEAMRNLSLVAEGMVAAFSHVKIDGKIILAADGSIPITEMKNLAKEGYNTGIAHCRNPFRDEDSVCKKFFTCFRCPNMMVFEDDLWRLFSFYFRLLAERIKLRPDHWLKTYGPIIRRIDQDIAPQFPLELVSEAKQRARIDPHPTWKGPL